MSQSKDETGNPGRARLVPFVAIAILTSSIFTFQESRANETKGPIADSDDQLITNAFRAIRGSFIENKGQVDEDIRYYSLGNPSVGFRDDGIMLVLSEIAERSSPLEKEALVRDTSIGGLAFLIHFEDSKNVAPRGNKELDFATNLLVGNNPARWSTGVRSYQEVVYTNLYDGISMEFHLSDQGLKYNFIVNGDIDPSRIRFAYEGVNNLSLDSEGGLHIYTSLGELRDAAPEAWRDGHAVPCSYTLPSRHVVGLRCTDWGGRDRLVIDPLIYSTFLGGSGSDHAWAVALDAADNAYVTGDTLSVDFPATPGTFDPSSNGGQDVFVVKMNATGTGLVYSTYIGGSGTDFGFSVVVDALDNVFLAGQTRSPNFPTTPGAFDRLCGTDGNCDFDGTRYHYDAFVAKLDAAGDSLVYSTFLGGKQSEGAHSIAVNPTGDAFVTGQTTSSDFPTTAGAFDRMCGTDGNCDFDGTTYHDDAFVTRFDAIGGGLIYSTFLGGANPDSGLSVKADSFGNAYLTGDTSSVGFPTTPGAYDVAFNGGLGDAFVTKLNPSGSALVYSTFLGGSGIDDTGESIAIDFLGNAYIVGQTYSSDFPTTPGAYDRSQNSPSQYDVFVTKINATGDGLIYSTFLGGSGEDGGTMEQVGLTATGDMYVTGFTNSPDFPTTPGAFDRTCGTFGNCDFDGTRYRYDAFLTLFDANGSSLVYSTFLGGEDDDFGRALATNAAGIAYVAGGTSSANFPTTPEAFHPVSVGGGDAFVLKFTPLPDLSVLSISSVPTPPILVGGSVAVVANLTNLGDVDAAMFEVLIFDDQNQDGVAGPGEDISSQSVALLPASEQADVSFPWAPNTTGTHSICAFVDSLNTVQESNETNNVACIDILVQPGPALRPDYVPVSPLPLPPVRVGTSSQVPLLIHVLNQGNSTSTDNAIVAFHEQSSPPFSTFILNPLAPATTSSRLTAMWTSPAIPGTYLVSVDVDYYDNVTEWDETNNVYTWTIEVISGPVTSLMVGSPSHTSPAMVMYVKSSTPLDLSVVDQSGTGINHTWYRIDNVTWTEYSSSFFLSGDVDRYVEWYSEDNVWNVEETSWRVLRVDDTPPATAISIGEPKYLAGGNFVKSSTPLTLSATDGGGGSNSTFYHLWGGSWTQWRDYSTPFSLAGRDGTWYVEFLSFDYLGNMETIQNETLILDDTPPATTISPAAVFNLTATDSGCGVNVTMYRIDGGSWTVYAGGFTLAEGAHTIYYYSIDKLGNVEQERSLVVKPPVEVAVNYKPIVAVIFAIVLLMAGVWSSKRKPWKGGKDRMAVMKAFMITLLPFVLAEAGTGIISFATGLLAIPPLIGIGTAVDISIFLIGLFVAIQRAIRVGKQE
jgi:hypothetical protein